MPFVLLIRHGENDYVKKGRLAGRLPGVHLNENGHTQAVRLAEALKDAPVKAVYSSPLDRTLETATPIAATLGLEVIARPGLVEVDFGEWQDRTLKSLRRLKEWKIVQNSPSLFQFPGGESFAAAQLRIATELQVLCAQADPKDLFICVSHSDLIKLAVAYFIGLSLDNFQRLHAAPGSITGLMINPSGSSLMTLNYDLAASFAKK
jgi:probable phosphomutase (TIGR03848 family)